VEILVPQKVAAGAPVPIAIRPKMIEAMNSEPLPGYVWLVTPGKVLHVDERVLEFTDELRSG
jgi:hypothetical protein